MSLSGTMNQLMTLFRTMNQLVSLLRAKNQLMSLPRTMNQLMSLPRTMNQLMPLPRTMYQLTSLPRTTYANSEARAEGPNHRPKTPNRRETLTLKCTSRNTNPETPTPQTPIFCFSLKPLRCCEPLFSFLSETGIVLFCIYQRFT